MKPFIVGVAEHHESIRSTIEAVAGSPKGVAATIGGNAAVLAVVKTEVITGYVALFSSIMSGLTVAVVCAYWMVKLAREWYGLRKDMK